MEVEVKIRLPSQAAYDKVAALLADGKKATYDQENYFFDGTSGELESRRAVLRLRFFNGNQKAVITCKGKQLLKDGIGRASEIEEDVPGDKVAEARGWLTDPDGLLKASPLVQKLNAEWGVQHLKCLGGFSNHRTEHAWESHTLELDATRYDWGTLYEIECETSEPEVLRDRLEALLSSNSIEYSYSATSKFANFINRSLL